MSVTLVAATAVIEATRKRAANHFAAERDHFSTCVAAGRACRTPGREGLTDIRVIAVIAEAIRTGKTVRL